MSARWSDCITGRVRVLPQADGAAAKVALADGTPLTAVSQIGKATDRPFAPTDAALAAAMTVDEFKALIRARLGAASGK